MRQDNINYLLVGSLVLSMAGLLGFVHMYLSGDNQSTDRYYTVYNNISGVTEGTNVTYGGYQIGKVNEISYDQNNGKTSFKLSLDVIEDWKIPKDSAARIVSSGLLADNSIDISEGQSTEALAPGGVIVGQEVVGMFDAINSVAEELKDLSKNSVRPMLDNVSNRFDSISTNIDNLSSDLEKNVPDMVTDATALMTSLNESADRIAQIVDKNNENHLDNLFKNADSISGNLNSLSKSLEQTVIKLDQVIDNANTVITNNEGDVRESVQDLRSTLDTIAQNIDSIVYNLDTTTRNTSEFSRKIRENPSAILSSSPPKDRGVVSK